MKSKTVPAVLVLWISLSFPHVHAQTYFDSRSDWADSGPTAKVVVDSSVSISNTALTYLNSFFEIIKEHSLRKDSVDVLDIRARTIDQFRHAQTTVDCRPAISFALKELADRHSFFMPYEQVQAWKSDSREYNRTGAGLLLPDNVAYISVPAFHSGSQQKMQHYADSLQQLIRSLDKNDVTGWIVDLRKNEGGNCWPMLAGIGPLLGDGICGYFMHSQESGQEWNYVNGSIYEADKELVRVSDPYYTKQEFSRVAVLTGPWTASSGEIVAVSFVGRPNTRSFGEPTYGVSTGNQDFTLSDGSILFLTTSVYADRNRHNYGGKIIPDEIVPHTEYLSPDQDPVLRKAVEWLIDSK